MSENLKTVVTGWSPEGDEQRFVVSPSHFCCQHRLSPCQSGVVFYLSRYQFERNPWLLKQSVLLLDLMLKFGVCRLPWHWRIQRLLGLPVYLAPRLRQHRLDTLNVATYCALNGIAARLMLAINLICDSPTEEGLKKAKGLLLKLI